MPFRPPRFLTILVLSSVAFGCAHPAKLYDGPERPDAEIVRLSSEGKVRIHRIDGRGVDRLESLFALLPGRHEIEFRVRQSFEHAVTNYPSWVRESVTWTCRIRVDLAAGRSYSLRQWLGVENGEIISTIRLYDDQSLAWAAPECVAGDPSES